MQIPTITTSLIFLLIGIGYLIYFSYIDFKRSEIENEPILMFFLIGVAFTFITKQYLAHGLLIAIIGILGLILWYLNCIGGADVKIMACLPLYLSFSGIPNALVKLWFFIIIFGICGLIYWAMAKFIIKSKEIPFMPIIALSFIILNLIEVN